CVTQSSKGFDWKTAVRIPCHSSLCFFQAEDGIRDGHMTGVQTCALPISSLANCSVRAAASSLVTRVLTSSTSGSTGTGLKKCRRSEERRVGKEGRSRWASDHRKTKEKYTKKNVSQIKLIGDRKQQKGSMQ